MITTTDTIVLVDSSIEKYDSPHMRVYPRYDIGTGTATVELALRTVAGVQIRYAEFVLTAAEINAVTVSATSNVDKWIEAVEKAVKAQLETLNPSATFTIV